MSIEHQLRQHFKGYVNNTRQFITTCPFCGKTSKFYINIDNGLYKCFRGSCQKKGHIGKIIKGIDVQRVAVFGKKSLFAKEYAPHQNKEDESELQYYKKIHKYLIDRGFNKQFLERNKVGYDDKRYSITIPIYFSGDYYGVIRRTIIKDYHPKYLYPKNLPRRSLLYIPIYVENPKTNKCLIVEGSLDALKCAQNGYFSVATLGCNPTMEQLEIIADYCSKNNLQPILLYDNDEAGKKGVDYALQQGFDGHIAMLDKLSDLCYNIVKKDPGELTKDELDYVVSNSVNKLRYKLEKYKSVYYKD